MEAVSLGNRGNAQEGACMGRGWGCGVGSGRVPGAKIWSEAGVWRQDLYASHRGMKQARFEGSSKDYLVQPFLGKGT